MVFWTVDKIKIKNKDVPVTTEINHPWKGAIPSFIVIVKTTKIPEISCPRKVDKREAQIKNKEATL